MLVAINNKTEIDEDIDEHIEEGRKKSSTCRSNVAFMMQSGTEQLVEDMIHQEYVMFELNAELQEFSIKIYDSKVQ